MINMARLARLDNLDMGMCLCIDAQAYRVVQ
jgi:hypothetical protein